MWDASSRRYPSPRYASAHRNTPIHSSFCRRAWATTARPWSAIRLLTDSLARPTPPHRAPAPTPPPPGKRGAADRFPSNVSESTRPYVLAHRRHEARRGGGDAADRSIAAQPGRSPLHAGVFGVEPGGDDGAGSLTRPLHALRHLDAEKAQHQLELAQGELRQTQARLAQSGIGLAQNVAGAVEARELLRQGEGEFA